MTDTGEDVPLLRRDGNAGEIDLDNRDPKLINEDVATVNFEDVFAEPDGIRSVDCLWTWSYKIYTCSKKYSYISLGCIFGFLFALIWGFLFAFLSFWHIWVIVPCVTACRVVFGCLIHPLIRIIKLFFFMPFKGLEKVLRITIEILRKRA